MAEISQVDDHCFSFECTGIPRIAMGDWLRFSEQVRLTVEVHFPFDLGRAGLEIVEEIVVRGV